MADTDIVRRIKYRFTTWQMSDLRSIVRENPSKEERDPLPFILTLVVGAFFKATDKYSGDFNGDQLHYGMAARLRRRGDYSTSQVRSKGKILISMIRRLSIWVT